MTKSIINNKRNGNRTEIPDYLVEFDQANGHDFGDIKDVSCDGMKIKTIANVGLGAISLSFKLRGFNKRTTVLGDVVWKDEKTYSYGIKFVNSFSPRSHW